MNPRGKNSRFDYSFTHFSWGGGGGAGSLSGWVGLCGVNSIIPRSPSSCTPGFGKKRRLVGLASSWLPCIRAAMYEKIGARMGQMSFTSWLIANYRGTPFQRRQRTSIRKSKPPGQGRRLRCEMKTAGGGRAEPQQPGVLFRRRKSGTFPIRSQRSQTKVLPKKLTRTFRAASTCRA